MNDGNQKVDGSHLLFFHTMEVNGAFPKLFGYSYSSKYLLLCSTEEWNSFLFGTTLWWANDGRIFILGWTIPL